MDGNSKTSTEWDWENLAMFSGKTIEVPKRVQLSSHEIDGEGVENGSLYLSAGAGFSGLDLGYRSSSKSSISVSADSSLKEGGKILSTADDLPKDYCQKEEFSVVDDSGGNFPTLGASVNSGESMTGLKLGKRTYFEDMCTASTSKTTSFSVIPRSSATTAKRSRASYHSTQTPRCQVEGCNLDLKSAKDYHRRHRICESHSKNPRVIVAGMERRFCQQCSAAGSMICRSSMITSEAVVGVCLITMHGAAGHSRRQSSSTLWETADEPFVERGPDASFTPHMAKCLQL